MNDRQKPRCDARVMLYLPLELRDVATEAARLSGVSRNRLVRLGLVHVVGLILARCETMLRNPAISAQRKLTINEFLRQGGIALDTLRCDKQTLEALREMPPRHTTALMRRLGVDARIRKPIPALNEIFKEEQEAEGANDGED